MNYFAVERANQCWTDVVLVNRDGQHTFDDFLNMSYDEMKSCKRLNDFVSACMEAADNKTTNPDHQTIITLIGEDNIFIWSIIMSYGENDIIRYCLIDWKKDGRAYRYEP